MSPIRLGLLGTFALWWYIQLVPTRELCEDSSALFRAVPQDFRTGDPYLDDSVATCTGYMAYGVDLFGAVYNNTICTANFTLIEHKSESLLLSHIPETFSFPDELRQTIPIEKH